MPRPTSCNRRRRWCPGKRDQMREGPTDEQKHSVRVGAKQSRFVWLSMALSKKQSQTPSRKLPRNPSPLPSLASPPLPPGARKAPRHPRHLVEVEHVKPTCRDSPSPAGLSRPLPLTAPESAWSPCILGTLVKASTSNPASSDDRSS
eukprot:285765-Chlamydomonas_euryale.AAC.4